ncbi:hypothetical protein pb186bvf_015465 [Paramecium bursaria]
MSFEFQLLQQFQHRSTLNFLIYTIFKIKDIQLLIDFQRIIQHKFPLNLIDIVISYDNMSIRIIMDLCDLGINNNIQNIDKLDNNTKVLVSKGQDDNGMFFYEEHQIYFQQDQIPYTIYVFVDKNGQKWVQGGRDTYEIYAMFFQNVALERRKRFCSWLTQRIFTPEEKMDFKEVQQK